MPKVSVGVKNLGDESFGGKKSLLHFTPVLEVLPGACLPRRFSTILSMVRLVCDT